MDAGEYEAALVPLRKARVMYASHYKDVDELIIQAQTALQQEKWDARPEEAKAQNGKRNPLFFIGAIVIILWRCSCSAFCICKGTTAALRFHR